MLLGSGASLGSFFPQRSLNPAAVDAYFLRHPALAPYLDALGLFDVFGAWWFWTIALLLGISLMGCLLPRLRAYLRALKHRPGPREAGPLPAFLVTGPSGAAPGEVLDRAGRILTRRGYRVARGDGWVAAEKGFLREAGSLLFHASLLALVGSFVLGRAWGFQGQAAIVEGDEWQDARVNYDFIREGRFFSGRFPDFLLKVEDFTVTYHPSGLPEDFRTRLEVVEGGRRREVVVRVNHPLEVAGVKVYQASYGWAPVIRVSQGERVLAGGPVVFITDPRTGVARGVVKVPGARPEQVGLELFLLPDPQVVEGVGLVNASPLPEHPILLFRLYAGDLGLNVPQSVFSLDKRGLRPAGDGFVPLGGEKEVAGVRVAFPELKEYTVLALTRDPGRKWALLFALLGLAGLLPGLYVARRRVWVRVSERDGAWLVEVAASPGGERAEEEYRRVAAGLLGAEKVAVSGRG